MDTTKPVNASEAAALADEPDRYPDPDGDYEEGRYFTCYSSEEFLAALESIRR